MKTFTFTLITICFFGIASVSQAQSLRQQENWLQAWKQFTGGNYSNTWLHNEVAESAAVFTNEDASNLVVVTQIDANHGADIVDALEMGIQFGAANRMTANGETHCINGMTYVNNLQGTLGGKYMYALVTARLDLDGGCTVVYSFSNQPGASEVATQDVAVALWDSVNPLLENTRTLSASR